MMNYIFCREQKLSFVRGANPIWLLDDLVGNLFDDNYYMFVLENDLPYIPATVWHDPLGSIAWTQPIQFFANGTLPIDIFFDSDEVYRLEFRQGPTQSDPLIYLVQNYSPGGGGNTPITAVSLASENQITNPQFSLVNFDPAEGLTIAATNPDPIPVAPGWDLIVTGTGTATINQVPLNNSASTINPTNAPYALQLTLASWSTAQLRQRFDQNGMQWANKIVSSSVTARIEGLPQEISITLVDSNSTLLATILTSTEIDDVFNEYTGFGELGATTNPDVPPAAYIDFLVTLPDNVDIYLTSFQVVSQTLPTVITYEQSTIERQVDHTFHNYRYSLLFRPKDTVVTAWNFSLNPYQFITRTITATSSQTQYIADQTIIHTSGAAGAVDTGSALVAAGIRQGLTIQANATSSNRFALIQYIPTQTIKQYWSYIMSSLVRAKLYTTHGTTVGLKMRLIHKPGIPDPLSNTYPIVSWAGVDPVFEGTWSEIIPVNDPIYNISTSFDPIEGNQAFPAYAFNGFQMPIETNANETLGVVVYTTDNMNNTATFDRIVFDSISLVPNEFAIDSSPYTYDDCLRQCQFFYEKSTSDGVLVTAANTDNAVFKQIIANTGGGNTEVYPGAFGLDYNTIKWLTPTTTLYTTSGTPDTVNTFGKRAGANFGGSPSTLAFSTNWTETNPGTKRVWYLPNNGSAIFSSGTTVASYQGFILFHYAADARIGA